MARGHRRRRHQKVLGAGHRAQRQELVDVCDLTAADLEERAAAQRADERRRTPLRRPQRPK